jgi:hypothetical protein
MTFVYKSSCYLSYDASPPTITVNSFRLYRHYFLNKFLISLSLFLFSCLLLPVTEKYGEVKFSVCLASK